MTNTTTAWVCAWASVPGSATGARADQAKGGRDSETARPDAVAARLEHSLRANDGRHYRLDAQDPQVNPKNANDWCWGILDRVAHLNAMRQEYVKGHERVARGSHLVFDVRVERGGRPVSAWTERWTVEDVTAQSARVRVTSDNLADKSVIQEVRLKPFDRKVFDPNDVTTCAPSFLYARGFATVRVKVGGKVDAGLYREQAILGGASMRDVVSGRVPFGIAETVTTETDANGEVVKTIRKVR